MPTIQPVIKWKVYWFRAPNSRVVEVCVYYDARGNEEPIPTELFQALLSLEVL